MLQCLSIKSSAATSSFPASPATVNENVRPSTSQGYSTEGSPATSTQRSPTINLTSEYSLTVQTDSYNEMWTKIHDPDESNHQVYDQNQVEAQVEHINGNEDQHQLHLSQVLQPNRECVEEALSHARPNTLTRLVSAYFDHSENTTNLCLLLHQSICRTRALYAPIQELLEILPLDNNDSISQSQCNKAFEVLLQFDSAENPFPCPDSHTFQEMRRCYSLLDEQLDRNLRKSHSRVRLFRHATSGSALCVIGTAVAVTVAAAVVATHALVAIVAAPLCTTAYFPRNLTKKELAHVAQLNAAKRYTYVVNNDLNTIDRCVVGLHSDIEGDKNLVRLGLERGIDKYCIQLVLKELRKNQENFMTLLKDLDEHICLCFNTINRARSLLLHEIQPHPTSNS